MSEKSKKFFKVLKILGWVILTIGALIDLVAFADFFIISMNNDGVSLVFLFWIGSPIISIGGILLFFGYFKHFDDNQGIDTFIKCDTCGYDNNNDANYCNNCGNTIDVVCPNCGAKNNSEAKFCNKCGKRLK
jgi:hypothetical protein